MIYMLDLNKKNKWTSLLDSDWFYDISELELWVFPEYLDGLELILWYIGLGLDIHLDYLTGLGLILL